MEVDGENHERVGNGKVLKCWAQKRCVFALVACRLNYSDPANLCTYYDSGI